MAKEHSFDIVSQVNLQEVDNAIQQAKREIETRYDFKGSVSAITREDQQLTVVSDDEYKLKSVIDILQSKLIKRDVSLKALNYRKVEPAAGGTVRQKIDLVNGIEQEQAKKISKRIKDAKLKVQVQIQGDQLRVSGKSRDDLQRAIQQVKDADIEIPLQFINYR